MYSPDIDKKCTTCQFGNLVVGTLDVMCIKYGIVPHDYICKKYKYDIFKKKVKRRKPVDKEFESEDFSID